MSRFLRWGVIGTGAISASVIPDLQTIPGSEIRAVVSRDPSNAQTFAAAHRIPFAETSIAGLLARDDIDAVYLATPYATHHALAKTIIGTGRNILVEKPITMTAAEASDLFRAGREARVFVMEGMWLAFNPAFRHAMTVAQSGRIGTPRTLRAAFSFPVDPLHPSRWNTHRSPGALLDQGIYPVTVAHTLFGIPDRITAAGRMRVGGVDETATIQLDYSDGRSAQLAASMIEHADPRAFIGGTDGWMSIGDLFWAAQNVTVHAGTIEEKFSHPVTEQFPFDGFGYRPMLTAVVQAIAAGELQHPAHDESATIANLTTLDTVRQILADLS